MTACTCNSFATSTSTPAVTCSSTSTGQAVLATGTGNNPVIQANNSGTTSNAMAIYATATSTPFCIFGEGGSVGVFGKSYANAGIGVRGESASGAAGNGYGVYGSANGTASYGGYFVGNFGVFGGATSGGYGVYGSIGIAGAYSGFFDNKVYVNGFLTKAGGGYQIDHPMDPENKYLNHCFVESPEMMNVYRGRTVLDANGEATIALPNYFDAAAELPEYQLTPIGAAMPTLHVAEEVSNGSFKLAGGVPGKSVSWLVSAARADKWAKANHPGVEIDKLEDEKGHFMHPELFGADNSKSVDKVKRAK